MANHVGGLHDRPNRISHYDVNVTDLGRSRSWYEATTTLRVVAQTSASRGFPELCHQVWPLQRLSPQGH